MALSVRWARDRMGALRRDAWSQGGTTGRPEVSAASLRSVCSTHQVFSCKAEGSQVCVASGRSWAARRIAKPLSEPSDDVGTVALHAQPIAVAIIRRGLT